MNFFFLFPLYVIFFFLSFIYNDEGIRFGLFVWIGSEKSSFVTVMTWLTWEWKVEIISSETKKKNEKNTELNQFNVVNNNDLFSFRLQIWLFSRDAKNQWVFSVFVPIEALLNVTQLQLRWFWWELLFSLLLHLNHSRWNEKMHAFEKNILFFFR